MAIPLEKNLRTGRTGLADKYARQSGIITMENGDKHTVKVLKQ